MKIMISPAKNMKINNDFFDYESLPLFTNEADKLYDLLSKLSYNELKEVLQANDKITFWHYQNYQNFNNIALSPAILCFNGIQYTYMSPLTFDDNQWKYVKENVFILSAFYGLLRAMDGVKPYRLEMINPFSSFTFNNLYDFWKDKIQKALYQNDDLVLNLCSSEYSRVVKPYLKKNQKFVSVFFYEMQDNKLRQKTVYLKMARGIMVRYLASIHAKTIQDVQSFSMAGYQYCDELSTETKLVFVRSK